MQLEATAAKIDVHCRAGSLEKGGESLYQVLYVHCRAGSLEMLTQEGAEGAASSLPCRQLRNSSP